jgi:phage terminase large subunit
MSPSDFPVGTTIEVNYTPRGGAAALFACRAPEVVLEGPAGTGKSYAALQKVHLALLKYPGSRGLLLRKTLIGLKASTLVTFREKVLHPAEGVQFWAARAEQPAHYAYPNGSKLVIGGLDKPGKIMSTEYDLCLFDEATDATLEDWESITTRLRNGRMPYQQLIGCVNPQGPHHWLNERLNAGQAVRLLSRHADNPVLTPAYLETLQRLTGVRRARLFSGLWAAADGAVYEEYYDAATHLIEPFPIPRDWPRYLVIDFGFTHPFVCQWWARDPDGRLYRYRELYHTKKLVQQHAEEIRRLSRWGERDGEPLPQAVICDPEDAEGRAQLTRHLGLVTQAANKAVEQGIQAVQARLQRQGDGRPRLYLLRGALVQRDPELAAAHLPTCTEEEIDGYVWDLSSGAKRGERPVKEHDHGVDCLRYLCATLDLQESTARYIRKPW